MRQEELFEAIGRIDEAYIHTEQPKRRRSRRLTRFAALAACLCLVFTGGIYSLARLGYFGAGCGSFPGTIVDGTYYFYVAHSGVYRYDGGTPEKVLGAWWVDEWSVNGYGVYYSCGRTFGVVPHETGRRQTLYRAGLFEASHVRHTLQQSGDAVLTVYDKQAETQKELLLDGKTGQVLSTLMAPTAYRDVDITYSDAHFQVGERVIELVPTQNPYGFDVQEGGASLLPEGVTVSRYSGRYFGDCLAFICKYPEKYQEGTMLFLRPDGNDTLLTIPADHYYHTGTEDYLLDVQYDGEGYDIWCLDTMTNETWELAVGDGPTIYSIVTDGTVAYGTAPWDDYQSLWRVVCDEQGRPTGLELLDSDILT